MSHPRHDLGAYALGALAPEEEDTLREHLAGCTSCRDEHARLAALRPLLDLAEQGPERAAIAEPPPLLEDAVLAGFAARRPHRGGPLLRVVLPSAAAGAAVAVAVVALL